MTRGGRSFSFLTGVVAASKVVRGIFLAGDELLRVEQLAVSPHPNLIDDRGLQIYEDRPWYVLSRARLAEECVESIVRDSHRRIAEENRRVSAMSAGGFQG